ncbi:Vitamin B12 dependent methionine synthase activation region [Desulfonispora thiosulfatigenes DSM 11270]|uniref:Vitamin B12 dependent methionine synthase activation region n=1 Tax=Desulfonispora thiosulfatigenes DSM 11270 TaxID=656914 RepID=A0A1W1V062_DESTI|nr:hypothetical protein [Desulfonispora thiosulfatigenes]SMB86745.1 Vitamin B12 dependent methionine synthase activation region [Desulfonispora thiosulfatigenes DSM 11270]
MGKDKFLANFPLNINIPSLVKENPSLKGAQEKIRKLEKLIQPHIFWQELKINSINEDKVNLALNQEKWTIESVYLSLGLKNCTHVTLLALTIGEGLPNYSQECLKKGLFYEASIADILGSHAVEMLADKFGNYLAQNYLSKGLYPSLRFSPGYGDFELDNQAKISASLNTKDSIKVTDNYLLEPVKSITALIGWSSIPKEKTYPTGEAKKGFCQGGQNCAFCKTWACRK